MCPPAKDPANDVAPARKPIDLDRRQTTVSSVVATVGTAIMAALIAGDGWIVGQRNLTALLVVFWGLYTACHAWLIYRSHLPLGPADFRAAALRRANQRRATLRRDTPGGGGLRQRLRRLVASFRRRWRIVERRGEDAPSWSVQISVLALMVVVSVMVNPELRASPLILSATFAMVAACWCNVIAVYARHYARLDSVAHGLSFPGTQRRGFIDYLYFAVAIQATFATTDVEVTSQRLRRVMIVHTIISFVFNSVTVAMIVSLMQGAITPD